MGAHTRFTDDDAAEKAENVVVDMPKQSLAEKKNKRRGPALKNVSHGRVNKKRSSGNKKSIRGRIRSLQRLLNNKGKEMSVSGKKAKETELVELLRIRDEHDRRELERKIAEKYRMVRFFERRKLERILENLGDEDKERKKQVERDLRYVKEYPKGRKYVALFPKGGHTEESRQKLEEMRVEIEEGTKEEKNVVVEEEDDFFLQG